MIYVLYGLENYQIQLKVKNISVDNNIDSLSISKYNAKTNNIDEIIFDASSMSLFGEKRLIIIEDSYFFSGEKCSDNLILEKIEKFLETFNENNIIIFTLTNEKIDERKKITKLAKKIGQVIEFNSKLECTSLIKEKLKDYKISSNCINLIKDYLNNELDLVEEEIEKLKIYKTDNEITEEDIKNVITEYPKIDFFEFIDNIINKNKLQSIKTYNELLKLNEEPIKIIVTLANQFRLMYQAKKLSQNGYSEKDIALELGEHPYRVKLCIQKASKYSDDVLISNLKELGEIDLNTKKGLIDSKTALELFILNL